MSKAEDCVVLSDTSWRANRAVNLADYLVYRHIREGRGGRTALVYRDHHLSYSWVADRVSRIASLLRNAGVHPGDCILLLIPDTPAFVSMFFAALQVGAIAVPVNPSLSGDDISQIAARVAPKLAVMDETYAAKFRGVRWSEARLFLVGDLLDRVGQIDEELVGVDRPDVDVYLAENALAYCLFSSGTTGVPKGIAHRHTDILECIEAYSLPVLSMDANDRVLAVPKLTFGYGLGGSLLSCFFVAGAAILIPEPSNREVIVEAAIRYKPTLFLGQPRLISDLLQGEIPEAFRRLRVAVTAGEVLVAALYRKWRSMLDVELLDGFGSTEIGHVFISNHLGDVREGCAGRVLEGFHVRILDDKGSPVPANTTGHLWVSGPSLATEYWKDPERTKSHFRDGWVRTGDLFRSDQDGYLYACGRSDEMIKAGCGQWVSPLEIESVLQEDGSVAECAVVGTSDGMGLIQPKAYVVLRPANRPSVEIEERLKRLVAERWPELPYKHLSAIEFVSALPRNAVGKLQRFRLNPVTLTEFSYDC